MMYNSSKHSYDSKASDNADIVQSKQTLIIEENMPVARFRDSGTGTEEISVYNVDTENVEIIGRSNPAKINKFIEKNTTDYVNNITTTDANNLYSTYNKNTQTGGQVETVNGYDINNPTIVNYWADWCGYSKKFSPHWEKFKKTAITNFPNLQITEINVKTDKELNSLAKRAGVNGYPTVIFYYDKKPNYHIAGNSTDEDINNFIRKIMKS